MGSSKKYYARIDIIRVLSCVSVFLYHLNWLKGGYLAVCTFFVLSGYLTCVSCFKKEKFSFKSYYINKFKHLYLPLVFVTFISVAIISLIPDINWFNLKPETTSVILGYNNFWQLSANLDYFARHISSPFMHLWYMGIILQFDLIFPFFFILFKKIGEKVSKYVSLSSVWIISVVFTIVFYFASISTNIMTVYYNTFTRIFSLFLGVALGFAHTYYKPVTFNNSECLNKWIFYIYLSILLILFCGIAADSKYFAIAMILVSLITCRLIDYGTTKSTEKLSKCNRFIKSLSNVSYEIYLVQYPIIFLLSNLNIDNITKNVLIVFLVIVVSYILHYAVNFKNDKRYKKLKVGLFIIVLIVSMFGFSKYIVAEDHTQEMKDLEEKLQLNAQIMEEKQKEFLNNQKMEEEIWNNTLKDLENDEKELSNLVSKLSIVGIGDSVMLGAVNNLYKQFPNGYFDAQVSRTAWVANDILIKLKNKGMLSENVVINLGANGDCPNWCKQDIMKTIGKRKVFWINTNNDEGINRTLENFAKDYDNLYIIDWMSISNGHRDYFIADNIHLTEKGRKVYTQTIYDEIYNVYLEEYNKKKEEILNSYEEKQKNRLTFFGNDILLNSYGYLKEDFKEAEFVIQSEFTYEFLMTEINNRIKNNTLTHKLVFMFDKSMTINEKDYIKLIELCGDKEIYILDSNGIMKNSYESVNVLKFYDEIKKNKSYLMPDNIHLTDEGNLALSSMLYEKITYIRDNK